MMGFATLNPSYALLLLPIDLAMVELLRPSSVPKASIAIPKLVIAKLNEAIHLSIRPRRSSDTFHSAVTCQAIASSSF